MSRGALLEGALLLMGALGFGIYACELSAPVSTLIPLSVGMLVLLVLLAWRNMSGGLHPAFFFLVLLLLFDGGGLLATCLPGSSFDPFSIALAQPAFDIPAPEQRLSLFLLVLSATLIYLPLRLLQIRTHYTPPTDTDLARWLLLLFLLTLPFHVCKNYQYLSYVRSHGGYLAIFQSQDHLAEAGFALRSLSQLCSAAFVGYFALERPRGRLWLATAIYCSISLIELLIGLRGKVLLFFVALLFLAKLKRGTHFQVRGLALLAGVLAVVAVATAGFREQKSTTVPPAEIAQVMLRSQGVSFDVLASAVALRPQFSRYRWSYLRHGLLSGFVSSSPATEPVGLIFEDDLSYALNPSAFHLGFGTGGNYLAEGYVSMGVFGVVAESLFISALLGFCALGLRGNALPFVWTLTAALWYLPRQDLATALGGCSKSLASLGLAFLTAAGARALHRLAFCSYRPHVQAQSGLVEAL